MKPTPNDLRKTAILAAAAAAGVSLWTSSASASEARPADFQTEFELDFLAKATVELAPEFTAADPSGDEKPTFQEAVVEVPSVVDEWECCAAPELIAPEATMEGWSLAVADYLDRYLDRPSEGQQPADAEATQAAAEEFGTHSTVCEFCLEELEAQADEKQLLQELVDFAAALQAPEPEPQVSTRAVPVGWQVLTQWTIARFEARAASFGAIDPSTPTGGEDCFRLPAAEQRQASLD